MISGAVAFPVASGSSLSAARSVLQEYHVADRAESIALHERVVETRPASEKKVQEWPCDGPGCGTMMRNKSEWQKYHKKFYCKRCYAANNVLPFGETEPRTTSGKRQQLICRGASF